MLAELTSMQLLCLRVTRLVETDRLTAGMASLAKMHTAQKAREIVAHARDIMGGNGILLEYHVARHHADMEAVFTFEGTDNIQSLIVGREVTGINAIVPKSDPGSGSAHPSIAQRPIGASSASSLSLSRGRPWRDRIGDVALVPSVCAFRDHCVSDRQTLWSGASETTE